MVLIILLATLQKSYDSETKALFVLILATMLRCFPLQEQFLKYKGIFIVYSVFQKDLPLSVMATSCLFGLIAQNRDMCELLLKTYRLLDDYQDLGLYPENTQAEMLFALQSYILNGEGKSYIVQNSSLLNNLIALSRGEVESSSLRDRYIEYCFRPKSGTTSRSPCTRGADLPLHLHKEP